MAIEWRQRLQFASQNPGIEVPGSIFDLVAGMLSCADGEDLVQFFKCECLGLRDEHQDQEPEDEAPDSIPGKRSLRLEGCKKMWPTE